MAGKKSILFVNPDYHTSFLLCRELRKLGWKAEVYCKPDYPALLLYSDDCFTDGKFNHIARSFLRVWFFFRRIIKYKYYVVYSSPFVYAIVPKGWRKFLGKYAALDLWILKSLGKKIVYFPSGCHEEALQADFREHHPDICNNCGIVSQCDDRRNQYALNLRNHYGDLSILNDPMPWRRIKSEPVKYKCLDLELWRPDLRVPTQYQLPRSPNIRIMHSFFDLGRCANGKNIKGSPYIVQAIERLKNEGYDVEYFYVDRVASKDMRFYQVQADIIVDQLIAGWFGSTAIEAMALGKPVVCYLHPQWKKEYLAMYPEYEELPIVEADINSIYQVLKKLVTDISYREHCRQQSRKFAERHYDCRSNAVDFADRLLKL